MTATAPARVAALTMRTAYRSLIVAAPLANLPVLRRVWDGGWRRLTENATGEATLRLHGARVTLPVGYAYPAFLRRWPSYNAPLVGAVRETAAVSGGGVRLVDVGAAIGDTALLVLERCSEAVTDVVCIEGDPVFFNLLQENLATVARTRAICALLSDKDESIASLVQTHPGTRSALGTDRAAATTLDATVASSGIGRIGVLKSDVDGFDGRVLAGAVRTLEHDAPTVVFEWHPRLYEATGNDWHQPFEVLHGCGYRRFIWFDKLGGFSHLDDGACERVDRVARVCLTDRGPMPDWHYDVVALSDQMPLDTQRLIDAAR